MLCAFVPPVTPPTTPRSISSRSNVDLGADFEIWSGISAGTVSGTTNDDTLSGSVAFLLMIHVSKMGLFAKTAICLDASSSWKLRDVKRTPVTSIIEMTA